MTEDPATAGRRSFRDSDSFSWQ